MGTNAGATGTATSASGLGGGEAAATRRWFALTTRGSRPYPEAAFAAGDVLVFGPETRGLPDPVLERFSAERRLRIPMRPGARSLNLSNAVAVVVYEAWRQIGWAGAGSG